MQNDDSHTLSAQPLEIATIGVGAAGKIGICRQPGLPNDLAADIKSIQQWAAQIVVTMTTHSELCDAGAAEIESELRPRGIKWIHLPVEDYGTLSPEAATEWPAISRKLQSILADGGAVLIHCKGGQGRSGMIALRLLVEMGENAKAALARVRKDRPNAVETQAQLAWGSIQPEQVPKP